MMTVTAIIPVYNVKQYLPRCLDSVLSQTVPFDKVIVVNDGSTDGSQEICAEYALKHHSIQLINKKNGGLVSAWMEGLKKTDSTFICFIDSDDYVSEDYLESLVNSLDQDVDMVCMGATQAFDTGEFRKFPVNGLAEGKYEIDDSFRSTMLSDKGAFFRPVASCRWGKLIRTDIVKKYAHYCTKEISYGEDQQLTLGVLLGCKKIRVIDAYKYYYQYNTASILHTYKKNLWDKIELLMRTIDHIPGIKEIPNYEKQFNTQYLLYFSECLRNESYNRSLSRATYQKLLSSPNVQSALQNYYNEKMRKADKQIIQYAKVNGYLRTRMFLELYKIIYKIRKVPG